MKITGKGNNRKIEVPTDTEIRVLLKKGYNRREVRNLLGNVSDQHIYNIYLVTWNGPRDPNKYPPLPGGTVLR